MDKPYVEHVAVRVRDLEWYLDFFQNTMGMKITLTDPPEGGEKPAQVWVGGMQLQRDENYDPAARGSEQMTHIGIVVDDIDEMCEKVYAHEGVVQAEGKDRNWFVLPDGPVLELVIR